MRKFKAFLCIFLSILILSISTFNICISQPFENNNLSLENLEKFCVLVNGCTQSALKNYKDSEEIEAVVYTGLDVKNPLVIFYVLLFYVTNSVDFDKLTSDPVYSTELVKNLNDDLKSKGIVNEKAQQFLSKYYDEIKNTIKLEFDTVGGFTFRAKKQTVEKMLSDDCTDFVIAGSVFMLNQGDLNSDGKKNDKDVNVIQNVVAKNYPYTNSDEQKFIEYSGDINSDGIVDVNDATKLQYSIK